MSANFPWHCEFHAEHGPGAFEADCGCYPRMLKWLEEHLSSCPSCVNLDEEEKDFMLYIRGGIKLDLWWNGTGAMHEERGEEE